MAHLANMELSYMQFASPWFDIYCKVLAPSSVALALFNEFIQWRSWTPSDWGTWFSAMGTVAAIFWAMYIARTDQRQRRQNEEALALVTASRVRITLFKATNEVDELAELLGSADSNSLTYANVIINVRGRLEQIEWWTDSDMVNLIPLPGLVAYKLTSARENVRHAHLLLGRRSVHDARSYLLQAKWELSQSRSIILDFMVIHRVIG